MNVSSPATKRFVFSKIRELASVLGMAVALLLLCLPLYSQGETGTILGAVTDQTGGAIAGATVTVTDTARGTVRTLTTDQSGSYNAPNLTPSTYTVRVEFKGFKAFERQSVVLEVASNVRVDATLQPGVETQTVTVTEAVPLIETTNATLGGTLQNTVMENLPLNGRNFQNLLNLRPGVQKYVGNAGWSNSSNGNRPHDNMYLVNGVDANDPWMAQSIMNAVMAAGDAGTMLPIESIDEFKTIFNPPAQYGWKPGAQINVGIKSGTNQIHGTAYAYGRDGAWDARDFFNTVPNVQPPVAVEQFGASIGGPIKKDKIFYFGNFESQRYSVGNPAVHSVPITAPGVGTLTGPGANNLIGACQSALGAGALTPVSAQLAGLSTSCVPLGNYPGLFPVNNGANGTNVQTGLLSTNTIWSGVGKIDYHVNANNTINAMYFISPGTGDFVDNATLEINPAWITSQYARSQAFSTAWTWTPSSNWVNEFRVGYSHYYQTFLTPDSSLSPLNYPFQGSTYSLNTGQTNPLYQGFPTIRLQSGFNSMQLGGSWPKYVGPDGVLDISDHISYLRGNHTFMFGGEILDNTSTNNVTQYAKGFFRFGPSDINGAPAGSLESYFAGVPNLTHYTTGNLLRHLSSQGYALFLQDDWRVKPRLTVNLGIRYELNTVLNERDNLIGNFDPILGPTQVGTGGLTSAYNGDHNNFAPRLGIAWDVRGNGKTVVRAGGSIIYEQSSFDSTEAIGNLLGLRTEPTGVPLYYTGPGGAVQSGVTQGGTIDVGATTLGGIGNNASIANAWQNNATTPLFGGSPACGDGTVAIASGALAGITPSPCTVLGVDRNLRTPYVMSWMADVQQAITDNLSLDVAYVGNRASKLLGLIDLNQPQMVGGFSPGWGNPAVAGTPAAQCLASAGTGYNNCAPSAALEAAAQPYNSKFPYLSNIQFLNNSNFSTYNALQVSLTQRTAHGLSYVLGYTYSRSLGTGYDNWSFLVPINSNNVNQLYGPTVFDATHALTYSLTYAIPGKQSKAQLLEGWSINSIVTLQSGQPWGVNDFSTDFSGTGEISNPSTNGEQWNFSGNPSAFKTSQALMNTNVLNGSPQGGIPYFPGASNPTCAARAAAVGPLATASLTNLGCYAVGNSVLTPPAYGSYGTMGINPFRGPAFYNWDFSITKEMKIKERLTAQFRAEFFNILNHPNLSNPFGGPGGDNTYTDPTAVGGASFGFRPQTPDVTSSNPVLGSGGPRAIQLGLKLIF
ncbi:MAG TPA: carboxypeptidase regulatory-like domain-containing protein [Candidatus Acidoferrales bacterium]|nr:carboxypeptidase regulatory-like domain-containing protein [Candidatus Acidoferrales bacterium]